MGVTHSLDPAGTPIAERRFAYGTEPPDAFLGRITGWQRLPRCAFPRPQISRVENHCDIIRTETDTEMEKETS